MTAAGATRSLPTWALTQLGQFLWLLAQLVVGPFLAIARRQFHWGAFVAAVAVFAAAAGSMGVLLWLEPLWLEDQREAVLWCGTLLAAALAGAASARVGRRVAFWELYLACLFVAALVTVHLAVGWHVLLAAAAAHLPLQLGGASHWGAGGRLDAGSFAAAFDTLSPGLMLLGPMWDRLVALAAIVAFLVAVIGSSLAYVTFADADAGTRARDARLELEWGIAMRHLRGRGHGRLASVTAVVAVAGIALGVAALVTVTAVMSGYQEDIRAKILSTNAHLVVQKYGIDFDSADEVIQAALKVPGVVAGAAFTFHEAMLSSGNNGVGVLLKGIEPASAARVTGVAENMCHPSPDGHACVPVDAAVAASALAAALQERGGVAGLAIGVELYKRLGHPIGTVVSITTPVGIAGARGNAPRRMLFRIGGVFRTGMHEFDARLSYLSIGAAQSLMGMGSAVNGVEFRVADPERVESIAPAVLKAVGRYPYRTLDWRELNSSIFTALKLQKIVMFLVLTFIVVVAAFNIASTLFMAVVEKAHEIGVLKSMGARDATVMKIFMLQGWLTGAAGTTLGVLLGLGLAWLIAQLEIPIAADVYMVEALRVRVRPLEVAITVLAALGISHLATIYPALKAARQSPVDAIRYD